MHVTVNFLGLFFWTGKIVFGLTRFSCLSVRMTDNFSASFGKSANDIHSVLLSPMEQPHKCSRVKEGNGIPPPSPPMDNYICNSNIYSQTSVPRTRMGRIPWMARTDLKVLSIFFIFLRRKPPFARTTIPWTVKLNKWSRQ
jgi:hypothetical protein